MDKVIPFYPIETEGGTREVEFTGNSSVLHIALCTAKTNINKLPRQNAVSDFIKTFSNTAASLLKKSTKEYKVEAIDMDQHINAGQEKTHVHVPPEYEYRAKI